MTPYYLIFNIFLRILWKMKGNGNISSGSKVFITEVNNMSYKIRVEALDEMFLVGMMGLKSHSVG